MITLIACVTTFQNKLAIGRNGELLFKLKQDMSFFKEITTNSLSKDSKLDKNIVLMGRKTYFSITQKHRPLSNRINIVLTNDKKLIKSSPIPRNLKLTKEVYFTNMETFKKIYVKYNPNVFVIGGSSIYNMFLYGGFFGLCNMYLTYVQSENGRDINFPLEHEPDTFMDYPQSIYKLIGYSEKYRGMSQLYGNISYRILMYKLNKDKNEYIVPSEEYKYLNFMTSILNFGGYRDDRTGTGTVSLFGNQLRFDISNSIPLVTTKKVPFKTIVHELLWILQGHTDANILKEKGVHIWNANTSREFLDKQGLQHYPEGILGAGYGWQLRHQGARYSYSFADISKNDESLIGGFDQLNYVEHLLKTDPFSRRIMFSYWNPIDFDKTALLPCHVTVQFYVTKEPNSNQKYLSCQYYMRSNDFFLAGQSFNIIFYSMLTYILALRCDMKPKEIIYTCGDSHIYKNHIGQVKEQLVRTPRPFPKLHLDNSIKNKDWKYITVNDFELIGYMPHPFIKAPMAI